MIRHRYIFLFLLSMSFHFCMSQDLTGTWEGTMGRDQFIQMNVIQNKDQLCGYTYDYIMNDRSNFCKAYFTGSYIKSEDRWLIKGDAFITNPSGSHALMRIRFSYYKIDDKEIIRGSVGYKSPLSTMLSMGVRQYVYMEKVSSRPSQFLPGMNDCLNDKKNNDSIKVKQVIVRDTVQKNADTIAASKPVIVTDSFQISKKMNERIKTNVTKLKVTTRKIYIRVYDNGIVDDDTVSVFYNDVLLLSHQHLSSKPINIELELKEGIGRHEIILFAENLGRIPPNTALLVVEAGDKRYELKASADLKQNASLLFEYVPR